MQPPTSSWFESSSIPGRGTSLRPGNTLLLLMALLLLLAGCGGTAASARSALDAGDLDEARRIASDGLEESPDDPELHALMSEIAMADKRWSDAILHARRSVELAPRSRRNHRLVVRAHMDGSRPAGLCSHIEDFVQLDPDAASEALGSPAETLPAAAAAALASGRGEWAVSCFAALEELDSTAFDANRDNYRTALQGAAALYEADGRFYAAITVYERLNRLDDGGAYHLKVSRLYHGLGDQSATLDSARRHTQSSVGTEAERNAAAGRLLLELGYPDAAAPYLSAAVEAGAGDQGLLLARALLLSGDEDNARQALVTYTNGADVNRYLEASRLANQLGWSQLAIEISNQGIEAHPDSLELALEQASQHHLAGRRPEMLATITAVADRAGSGSAYFTLGSWLLERGYADPALDYLQRAADEPDSPPETHFQLAKASLEKRDYYGMELNLRAYTRENPNREARLKAANLALNENSPSVAVDILEPQFEEDPSDTQITQLLAESYDFLQLNDKEADTYRRWAEASEKPGESWLTVGDVYQRSGDYERAETAYREALTFKESKGEAHFLLGQLLLFMGRQDDATAEFDDFVAQSADTGAAWLRVFNVFHEELDDTPRAIAVARRAMEMNPESASTLLPAIAEAQLDARAIVEAQETWLEWIDQQPDVAEATSAAISSLRGRGGPDFGVELAYAVRENHADAPGLTRVIGDALWQQATRVSRYDPRLARTLRRKAADEYQAFIDSTSDQGSLARFGTRMRASQLHQQAVAAFEKAGEAKLSNAAFWFAYGESLTHVNRVSDATTAFDRAIQMAGDSGAQLRIDAANVLSAEGFTEEAAPYLRQVVAQERNDMGLLAFDLLAGLLINAGDRDALRKAASDVLAGYPRFETRRSVASAFAKAGLYERALEVYRAMLTERPNAFSVVEQIAILGIVQDEGADEENDPEESTAEGILTRFAEQSSTPTGTWAQIAAFYESRGEHEAALKAYQNAVNATQIPDVELVLLLADNHARLGQFDQAEQRFNEALELPSDKQEVFRRAITAFRAAGQLSLASRFARRAIDALPSSQSGPFMLLEAEAALAAGKTASGLQWIEQYRKNGHPLPPAVELLIAAGSFEQARGLLVQEVDLNLFFAAQEHLVELSDRWILYEGLDRMLSSVGSLLARTPAQAGLERAIAGIVSVAHRPLDALVRLGELQRQGDATLREQMMQFELLLNRGLDSRAMDLASQVVAVDEVPLALERYRLLVDSALDSSREDMAALLLERGVREGLTPLEVDRVAVALHVDGPDAALDVLHSSSLGKVFAESTEPDIAALAVDALRELTAAGYAREALQELTILSQVQGATSSSQLAAIEALAWSNQSDSVEDAVDDFLESHSGDEERLALARTLINTGSSADAVLGPLLDTADPEVSRAAMQLQVLSASPGQARSDAALNWVQDRDDQYSALMQAGEALQSLAQHRDAASLFERATGIVPSNPLASEELALSSYFHGDFERARAALFRSARQRPNRLDALVELAGFFTTGPDSGVSAALLERAAQLSPGDARLQVELARQLYLAGRPEMGDSWAEKFIEQSDSPTRARGMLVRILLEAGQIDRAVAQAELVVAADNAGGEALFETGVALLEAGRDENAIAVFDRAIAVSLGPLELQMRIADQFRRIGRLDQFERYIEKAIEAEPDSPAPTLYRGLLRLDRDDVEGAMFDFNRTLAGGWEPLRTRRTAGLALLESGATDEAAEVLAPVLKLRSVDVLSRLELVLDTYNQANQAAAGLKLVLDEAPGLVMMPSRRPEVAHLLAVAALRAGQVEEAGQIAVSTTRRNPETGWGWDALARVRLARGELNEAREAATHAVDNAATPTDRGRFMATLGRIAWAEEDADEAEAVWLQAIRVASTGGSADSAWLVTVYQALAHVADQSGRSDAALAYRQRAARAKAAP